MKSIIKLFTIAVIIIIPKLVSSQKIDSIAINYLEKHQDLLIVYESIYNANKDTYLSYGLTETEIIEYKPKFQINRSGNKGQNLEILFEVAMIKKRISFDTGVYKILFVDNTIIGMLSSLNNYLSGKEDKDIEKINIIGTITGIADANPIGSTKYNGEFGNIIN